MSPSGGLIETLLDPAGLEVRFQPVFQLEGETATDRRLLNLEALIRGPRGSNMEAPAVLFDYVRRKREEVAMDRVCVARALEAAAGLGRPVSLSLNIHAATLSRDPEFLTFLGDTSEDNGIPPSRLTLEISHRAPLWEGESLASALDALRHIGIALALDDVGLGQGNFQMILDCKPDFFKVDGYFVRGCAGDFHRQAILESIVGLGRRFGARVIAEAVESDLELAALRRLGINLAQGDLLGPPLRPSELLASGVLDIPAVEG
jgi:EAL domain-containing protein (putative c-di-GMP-specific phosphodiesterase class I)